MLAAEDPLIVQGDLTVLVEVYSPRYAAARDALARFAELVKSPEHIHTYRITPLSVWNACAAGCTPEWIIESLEVYAKYRLPDHVRVQVQDLAGRYGKLRLIRHESDMLLSVADAILAEEISRQDQVKPHLSRRLSPTTFVVPLSARGQIKQALVKIGYPAEDLAGYVGGEKLAIGLRTPESLGGKPFGLRHYQRDAAEVFYAGGSDRGGSGVIVLPCGAGKTIVGMATMAQLQCSTMILTSSVTAVRQWISELLDKTTLMPDQIGEYTGQNKEIRPVTVVTYQVLTHRKSKTGEFPHMGVFDGRNWGLIIYDEVHLLPAPIFQITADLQARRRLGLTATLVREDGREDEVFALIGPKKADVPWKDLEHQGWIATAICTEVRLEMPESVRMTYALTDHRNKFRVAAENPDKFALVLEILKRHSGEPALVIGTYVEQIEALAKLIGAPVLTGATPQRRRDQAYADFKAGKVGVLAVSKVANFALDLPEAAVAIQISGTFGSRQEEAQRLGRILRPKSGANQAHFYSLVSQDTLEQDFAMKRQLFLCEQGYEYRIVHAAEWADRETMSAA